MGWNVGLSSLVRSREVGAITFFKIMPVVFQAVCTRLGARLGRRFPLVSCQLLGDRCSLRSLPLLLADCLLLLLPADCLLWLPADCLPPPPLGRQPSCTGLVSSDTVFSPFETAATTCQGTNSNKHGELKNHQFQLFIIMKTAHRCNGCSAVSVIGQSGGT